VRRRGLFGQSARGTLGAVGLALARPGAGGPPGPAGPPNVLTLAPEGSGYAVSQLLTSARARYGPVWETVYATTGTIRTGWEAR
jgi:hypothetical protein